MKRNLYAQNPPLKAWQAAACLRMWLLVVCSFCLVTSRSYAQDILWGLTSRLGPEGAGTAFSLQSTGTDFNVHKAFVAPPSNPVGSLVQGNDGSFYGMTNQGGSNDRGTVFRIGADGTSFAVLKSFNGSDGANPVGSLVKGNNGSFYGMTVNGGGNDRGTVFRIGADGTGFAVLKSFNGTDDGGIPAGGLIIQKKICTPPTPAITAKPTSNVYTGGNPNVIYLGYGPQRVKLEASGGESYKWSPATGLSSVTSATPVFTPTKAGTYTFTVEVTDKGCSATTSVTITVIDVRFGNKKNQVIICHYGKSNNIDVASVPDHLAHGDYLGDCMATIPALASSRSYATETEFALQPVLKNAPNPFSGQTTIEFVLTQDEAYNLDIYDSNGRLIKRLSQGKAKAGKLNQVEWQVGNAAAGLYIARLTSATSVQQLKLMAE